jgi:ABC-2 type transport system permease protein
MLPGYMVSQFMLMFMILPLAIPVTISAYSIVGEKATRSLEPLLATPITPVELLVGKSLAAAIPAIVATYLAFAIYAVGAWMLIANKDLYTALLDARWLIAIFLVGPLYILLLLSLLSASFALALPSRRFRIRQSCACRGILVIPPLAGGRFKVLSPWLTAVRRMSLE